MSPSASTSPLTNRSNRSHADAFSRRDSTRPRYETGHTPRASAKPMEPREAPGCWRGTREANLAIGPPAQPCEGRARQMTLALRLPALHRRHFASRLPPLMRRRETKSIRNIIQKQLCQAGSEAERYPQGIYFPFAPSFAALRASAIASLNCSAVRPPGTRKVPTTNAGVPRKPNASA